MFSWCRSPLTSGPTSKHGLLLLFSRIDQSGDSISPAEQSPGGRVSRPRSPRTRRRRGGGPWWTRGWSSGPRTPPPSTWAAGSHKPCLSNQREWAVSRFFAMQGFATDWTIAGSIEAGSWGYRGWALEAMSQAGDLTGQRLVSRPDGVCVTWYWIMGSNCADSSTTATSW